MIDRHIGIHLDKIALVRERERETCLPIMSITIMIAFHCERLLFSAVHVYYRFDIRWKYGNEKTRRTCIIIIKRTGGVNNIKRDEIFTQCVLSYYIAYLLSISRKKIAILYIMRWIYFFTTYFKDLLSSLSTWPLQAGIFFLYLLSSQIVFFFFSSPWKFQ